MASHGLRTPLTALRGYLQMLERAIDRSRERPARYVRLTLDQVQRLTTHVTDLMDVARLRSGKLPITPTPVDLVQVLRQAVETAQAQTTRKRIGLNAPETPLPIDGDAIRLEQVLHHLIGNAITYAPDAESIQVGVHVEDGVAVVDVRDFGQWILSEDLERIFLRFAHGDVAGSGVHLGLRLGLHIAREIIEGHSGTIEARSTPGEGATFTVRLPLRPDHGGAETPPSSEPRKGQPKRRQGGPSRSA